jgi:hypothetical protein
MSLEDTVSILIIEFDVAALDIFVRILQQWNRRHFGQIAEIKANVIEKSDQTLQQQRTVGIGYDKYQNRINERFLKLFGEKSTKNKVAQLQLTGFAVLHNNGKGREKESEILLHFCTSPLPAAPPTYHSQINNTPRDKNLHFNFGN